MPKVHILSPDIVAKIAAGEVIDRPASVIKELIENSLDAQATCIEIDLKKAGKTFISVKDNGSGIEQDDLKKVFSRHATSKISSAHDLTAIHSLGFRGEALYSIAAIADVVLQSKPAKQETGFEIHTRGGQEISFRPVNIPNGTQLEVRELFFNTPARRKFLKSDTTELRQILAFFIPYAILYPAVRFILRHNGKTLFDLLPEKTLKERIAQALNLDQKDIIEVSRSFSHQKTTLHFFLGNINIQRARKDMQFVFVNNRPVQHRHLAFHINQKYQLIFPPEVSPFFCIYLKLPAENVDVNIHPTKREVKIKGEQELFTLVREIVEETLMREGDPRKAETIFKPQKKTSSTYAVEQAEDTDRHPSTYRIPSYSPPLQEKIAKLHKDSPVKEKQEEFFGSRLNSLREKLRHARFIGQMANKFLLFEAGRALLIFDQHAAQERIVFESLLKQIQENRLEIQNLLTPITLKLSPQEILSLENLKDKLHDLGFSYTMFDEETMAIQSHPNLIQNPALAIRYLLAEEDISAVDNETLARRACRKSVMSGDYLKPEQAEYQRKQLLECRDPFVCPHGRPTVIEISESFLDKQFLRK